jgi:hypothetical protein
MGMALSSLAPRRRAARKLYSLRVATVGLLPLGLVPLGLVPREAILLLAAVDASRMRVLRVIAWGVRRRGLVWWVGLSTHACLGLFARRPRDSSGRC